jgi:hypothetical protein
MQSRVRTRRGCRPGPVPQLHFAVISQPEDRRAGGHSLAHVPAAAGTGRGVSMRVDDDVRHISVGVS